MKANENVSFDKIDNILFNKKYQEALNKIRKFREEFFENYQPKKIEQNKTNYQPQYFDNDYDIDNDNNNNNENKAKPKKGKKEKRKKKGKDDDDDDKPKRKHKRKKSE